jgi:hypothetical protein
MQKQKSHGGPTGGADVKEQDVHDNKEATQAVAKGKDLMAKLQEATKRKRGRYVVDCCGVRRWVED